ncbi:MAG: fused MFS/spermidine synthase [Planctomycetes bacterium]|nr:fused MFS/spermidine synthase [Planctomycetota bacterium]
MSADQATIELPQSPTEEPLIADSTPPKNRPRSEAHASDPQPAPISKSVSFAVHAVFFLSGAASLICEVVWFKQLQFILGSSTFATSVVVASFFLGLGLGSWYCGRRVDGWGHLLRNYAWLELALAALSATVTLALAMSATWIEWLAPWLALDSPARMPLMIALSVICLMPPTTLMGATLPVLAKYLVRRRGDLAARIGKLYGLNTLGAACGCFLVGFFLIGYFGVIQAAMFGTGIYLLIAVAVGVMAGATAGSPSSAPESTHDTAGQASSGTQLQASNVTHPETSQSNPCPLVIIFAVTGFASIAYEVLWFRLLTNFSIQSVYAFSGMLSVYLLGLVIGAFVCSRWLAPKKDKLLSYFARVQLLIAVTAMISLGLLGRSSNILHAIGKVQRWLGIDEFMFTAFSGTSSFLFLALVVLLLPATLIGISFPLASELTVHRINRLGRRLGLLYGLNTLGGVFGSLVVGFVLLPLLGSQMSFLIVVTLSMLLFVAIVLSQSSLRRQGWLYREGAITAAVLVGMAFYLGPDYLKKSQTAYVGAEVLDFRETKDATFLVLNYESDITQPYQQILVNGKSFANNSPPGRRYMSVLAHLPALLHEEPKEAVVIAIGTGTTVGCLTLHPTIDTLWAVDISQDVFDFAQHFVPLNHDFVNSPKVRTVAADGRHFLLCTDRRFDVLTFEPPPPNDAGVVNLYSRDFYRLARRRMAPGGIVCQWIPLDLPRGDLSRMLIQSMMAEFPHVSLWISNRCEGIAIASEQPLRIDVDRLRRRMSHPALQNDMAAYALGQPEQLLATFFAADEDLARFVGDVPTITDNRPRVEYFSHYERKKLRYDEILKYRTPVDAYLTSSDTLNRQRLAQAIDVHTDVLFAHELRTDHQYAAARRRLERAAAQSPGNPYVSYLLDLLDQEQERYAAAQ